MSSTPSEPHPYAGKRVRLKPGRGVAALDGAEVKVNGRFLDICGRCWHEDQSEPAVQHFYARALANMIPVNDEGVIVGRVRGLCFVFHDSEVAEVIPDAD